jgi:putative redox protein
VSNVTVARWKANLRFRARTGTGAEIDLEGAGQDDAAKPSELLLAALCGCTGMDVISICRKKRQHVTAYTVGARGEQRNTHPRTFEWIELEHRFHGETLDEAAIARAVELSATRYCLVSAMLSGGDTRISHRYQIGEGDEARSAEVVVTGPFGAGLEKGSGPLELSPPRA